MDSKAGCLADFWHHRVTTMSSHTHAYLNLLFKVDQKQICEQWLYVEKIQNNCLSRLTGSKTNKIFEVVIIASLVLLELYVIALFYVV